MTAMPNKWKDEYNHYVNMASANGDEAVMDYTEYLETMLDYLMATSQEFVANVVDALDTFTDGAEEHIAKLHNALEEQAD
jgi:hypothetical protein